MSRELFSVCKIFIVNILTEPNIKDFLVPLRKIDERNEHLDGTYVDCLRLFISNDESGTHLIYLPANALNGDLLKSLTHLGPWTVKVM